MLAALPALDTAANDDFAVGGRRPALIGYAAIALTFGGLGLWAALAPLDSATVASGQVAIESDRKPIQHLEGGIVREILVSEAQHVDQGQILFRLEPVQAMASLDTLRNQLDDDRAKEARLLAERDGASSFTLPPGLEGAGVTPETTAFVADQRRQFDEHRRTIDNDVRLQQARIDQANQDIAGKSQQEALLQEQLDSYNTEFAGLEELTRKGYYPRNKLNVTARERLRLVGELQGVKSDIGRSRSAIGEAKLQIEQIHQHAVDQATQDLATLRGQMGDVSDKLKVARDVLARQDVRAPRAGIVQNIKIHTVGAVLRPGDTLADLVTVADRLIMTAKVMPSDIQNVRANQRTEVRFPTMSHEQKQPAFGRIESLSAEAINDETSHQAYYDARVVLDPATLEKKVADKLVPGMPADLIIVNGKRTALDYLMEPIRQRFTKSLRER